ncbi:hypothetical protein EK21DRAFT_83526 [Setomelanomma holmii]|uniref:Uncharacterized protein n=1 Tax=Setomelanomma holmii TaxID=210430 RepID=A0A9P4LTD5_9PLEO|nr:hypothetical protein EK21DRAFT_83526 [Setomelanomma holmii]
MHRLSFEPPPPYIASDPSPSYTSDPEPPTPPRRTDWATDLEAYRPPRPIHAPPRTYVPTRAPTIAISHNFGGQSINLTSLTRPRRAQDEEEDYGISSSRSRAHGRRAGQHIRRGTGLTGGECCCLIFLLVVVVAVAVPLVVVLNRGGITWDRSDCVGHLNGFCIGRLGVCKSPSKTPSRDEYTGAPSSRRCQQCSIHTPSIPVPLPSTPPIVNPPSPPSPVPQSNSTTTPILKLPTYA